MKRRRWKSPDLVLQELESRTLLSVTAFLNPANSTDLEVDLSATGDQAQIMPSATMSTFDASNIVVGGTDYSGAPLFQGVTEISVNNTSGQTDAKQSVTFQPAAGGSSKFTLDAASGTNALLVNGISSVTFTGVTIDAISGNVDVTASATTSDSGMLATDAPSAAITVESGAAITADNVTLDATASSTYTYSAPLGGAPNDLGAAAAIADIEPSAKVKVAGSSIKVNGTGGNVTIDSDATATVNAIVTVGVDGLNPVAAAIATSVVNSSAVTEVIGSTVQAGSGNVNIGSTNTTTVTTEVDGTSAAGGASAAVAVDKSVSQADVVDGSNVSGGTVGITATTTNTATTTASSTTGGASSSINDQIKNILEGTSTRTTARGLLPPQRTLPGPLR